MLTAFKTKRKYKLPVIVTNKVFATPLSRRTYSSTRTTANIFCKTYFFFDSEETLTCSAEVFYLYKGVVSAFSLFNIHLTMSRAWGGVESSITLTYFIPIELSDFKPLLDLFGLLLFEHLFHQLMHSFWFA